MGTRECFIYSTKPKYSVDVLGKRLVEHESFKGEDAPFWLVCKTVAKNDLNKASVKIFDVEKEMDPITLKKGQEALCIGYEKPYDVKACLPFRIRKDIVVVDAWQFVDMDYTEVWEDKPITINGKSYFAELKIKDEEIEAELTDEPKSAEQRETSDFFDDEPVSKVTPAKTLPEGWFWTNNYDGSGSLKSPEGKRYFSYDLVPYAAIGEIEYRRDDTKHWTNFCGSLSDFMVFAESEINKELIKTYESLSDKIATAKQKVSGSTEMTASKEKDILEI